MPNSTAATLAPLFGLRGLREKKVKERVKKNKKSEQTEGDTIQQLTDSILQSAAGTPFNFSLSDQQEKQNAARAAMKAMMLTELLNPTQSDSPESSDKSKKAPTK